MSTKRGCCETTCTTKLYTCARCKVQVECKPNRKGHFAMPMGWKTVAANAIWCKTCVSQGYCLRALTFPVLPSDLREPERDESGAKKKQREAHNSRCWKNMDKDLQHIWSLSTGLANWGVHQLYGMDRVRLPHMKKCPPLPQTKLDDLFREDYPDRDRWEGSYRNAYNILRRVEAYWRKKRLAILWQNRERPPVFRYPFPYLVRTGAWHVHWAKGGRPQVTFALPNRGLTTIQLARGRGMRPQLKGFQQLLDGHAIPAEASLYRKNNRVYCKLVARFPRTEQVKGWNTLLLSHHPECLWVAEVSRYKLKESEPEKVFLELTKSQRTQVWVQNADDIRGVHERHLDILERLRQDIKQEMRLQRKTRGIYEAMRRKSEKNQRRLHDWSHKVVNTVVALAARREASTIVYDNKDCGYFRSFDYSGLLSKLRNECQQKGITLMVRSEWEGEKDAQRKEK